MGKVNNDMLKRTIVSFMKLVEEKWNSLDIEALKSFDSETWNAVTDTCKDFPDLKALQEELRKKAANHERRLIEHEQRHDDHDKKDNEQDQRHDDHDRKDNEQDQRLDDHEGKFEDHEGRLNDLKGTVCPLYIEPCFKLLQRFSKLNFMNLIRHLYDIYHTLSPPLSPPSTDIDYLLVILSFSVFESHN